MITQQTTQLAWTGEPKPPCVRVLGIPVHIIETRDVVRQMEEWILQRDKCHWIAVTGSHGIVEGHKHPEFKSILESADLSLLDGRWTARLAGQRASCPARQVRGIDLLWTFCEVASRKRYRNFFYGDTVGVLAQLTKSLGDRLPGLEVVGTFSPPFRSLSAEEDVHIISMINKTRPDVLWVGLGLPKQERWIFSHRDKLKVPVIVAVGAAFKFVSGNVKKAPSYISECGLEWLWRFAHEPRRLWHRVVVYGPQFVVHALLELSGLRKYD